MSLRFVALMLLALGSISDVHADDTIEPATELDAASQAAISRTQEWWTAFAMNDAAYLRAHTASEMTLTLANGGTFDRAGLLTLSATFTAGATMKMEWPTQSVRFATPDLTIVHGRLDERVGPNGSIYRVLTVLERRNGQWWVTTAQTTRELIAAPRIQLADAGAIDDLVGNYLTPMHHRLQVMHGDNGLVILTPEGQTHPMEPIGPSLFELDDVLLGQGLVRFAFARDAQGKVTAMTRLTAGGLAVFLRE